MEARSQARLGDTNPSILTDILPDIGAGGSEFDWKSDGLVNRSFMHLRALPVMGILSLIYMLLALVAELLLCRPGGPVLVSLSLCHAAVPWRCALSCGALCQIPQRAESRLRCGTRGTGNSQTGQSCLQTSSLCCTSKHFTHACKLTHL